MKDIIILFTLADKPLFDNVLRNYTGIRERKASLKKIKSDRTIILIKNIFCLFSYPKGRLEQQRCIDVGLYHLRELKKYQIDFLLEDTLAISYDLSIIGKISPPLFDWLISKKRPVYCDK